MASTFENFTALRGFHIYSNTVNWKPSIGQKISFKREHNNNYDKFAVACKTLFKGQIGAVTVGYIPRELSRHTWYAIPEGEKFQATVYDTKAKLSSLIRDGLEIPIKIIWSQEEKLWKFKAKVKEFKHPMTGEYKDDSKSILNEIKVHNDEDDDIDDDLAHDDDEELFEVEEQYRGDEEDVEIIDLEK